MNARAYVMFQESYLQCKVSPCTLHVLSAEIHVLCTSKLKSTNIGQGSWPPRLHVALELLPEAAGRSAGHGVITKNRTYVLLTLWNSSNVLVCSVSYVHAGANSATEHSGAAHRRQHTVVCPTCNISPLIPATSKGDQIIEMKKRATEQ